MLSPGQHRSGSVTGAASTFLWRDFRLSRLDDAGLRWRLRSSLTGTRARSLRCSDAALPASPIRDDRRREGRAGLSLLRRRVGVDAASGGLPSAAGARFWSAVVAVLYGGAW